MVKISRQNLAPPLVFRYAASVARIPPHSAATGHAVRCDRGIGSPRILYRELSTHWSLLTVQRHTNAARTLQSDCGDCAGAGPVELYHKPEIRAIELYHRDHKPRNQIH